MWAFLVGLLPFLQDIVNWWQGVEAKQTSADTAETSAEAAHQNDGAQSVADQQSGEAQDASLEQIAQQMDSAPAASVEVPK